MRVALVIICFLFSMKSGMCQDSVYTGKVVYTLSTQINGKTSKTPVAFFFKLENYTQYFISAQTSNDQLLREIEKRKSVNIKDSGRYKELTNTIKANTANLQYQPVYGSLKSNLITTRWVEPYTKKEYCILDSVSSVIWQLTDDTATIADLKCQKAIGKSKSGNYEAWFTSSIPVAVAPFQFRGLPGLLVEVVNTTNNNHLRLVELTWPYYDIFPNSTCEIRSTISKEQRDIIFAQEDAKARNKAEELRKAFELKKSTNRD